MSALVSCLFLCALSLTTAVFDPFKETAGTSVPPILNEIKTHQTPPTFHRTTVFTEAFQTIIDSYGVASYQEVNPGLFTVVTFPFLFAVMFGDLGHGIIAFLAGITMVLYEKRLSKADLGEMFETFFLSVVLFLLSNVQVIR